MPIRREVDEVKVNQPNRVYNNTLVVDSDLFKLEMSLMEKNIAVEGQMPNIEKIEHCHFYRTFDSSGKATERCSYVGGHNHEVKVAFEKDGSITAICGQQLGGLNSDTHIHNVRYIKSDKVEKRRVNTDAQKYIDQMSKI